MVFPHRAPSGCSPPQQGQCPAGALSFGGPDERVEGPVPSWLEAVRGSPLVEGPSVPLRPFLRVVCSCWGVGVLCQFPAPFHFLVFGRLCALQAFRSCLFFILLFFFALLFRATLMAHGGSQVRGQMGATAAGLHHSHGHAGSKLHLQPTPQLTATLDP